MKRKKTFYILRYIFAVVLIIGGLGNLSSSVPFGLCVTLAGVSLFPFIWNLIRKKAAIARWVPLLVPLFISAFRRANDLALAMEARCYHGGEGRTQMKPLRYQTRDYAAYGVLVAYLVCSIGLRVCGL